MRHGLATLFLGVSLALAYGFPGNSVTRAVRASTPTSTTWSFELPEDLSPIKRSTLRAQLSSAVNRHHTSWASAVDIHGLPGGDRPAGGLLRPTVARPLGSPRCNVPLLCRVQRRNSSAPCSRPAKCSSPSSCSPTSAWRSLLLLPSVSWSSRRRRKDLDAMEAALVAEQLYYDVVGDGAARRAARWRPRWPPRR